MTPIDQQIQTMEDLAARHYPDDELQRTACLVRLLTERLRTFHTMYENANRQENLAKLRVMDFDDLRKAGFTPGEISLGLQDIVR